VATHVGAESRARGSGGLPRVFAQQAAEARSADHLSDQLARLPTSQLSSKPEAPMRSRQVVVLYVLGQYATEMPLARISNQSNAPRRAEPIQRSRTAFARGARG
jgi:hypothetical protein